MSTFQKEEFISKLGLSGISGKSFKTSRGLLTETQIITTASFFGFDSAEVSMFLSEYRDTQKQKPKRVIANEDMHRGIVEKYSVYIDVDRPKKLFVLDNITYQAVKIDPESHAIACKALGLKEPDIYAMRRFGRFIFDKCNPVQMEHQDCDSGDLVKSLDVINTYVTPSWRKQKPSDKDIYLPKDIEFLVKRLFTTEESQEYFYHFIYWVLVSRCEVVLTLLTGKGTGKGLLIDHVLASLCGIDYSGKADNSMLTEKWNASIEDSLFLHLDEVDLSSTIAISKIKEMTNAITKLEGKTTNAVKNHINITSLVISSNNKYKTKIDFSDRRFSILDTTDTPLISPSSWTQKQAREFSDKYSPVNTKTIEKIENENKDLRAFGWWILEERFKSGKFDFNPNQPLKSETFYRVVYKSLSTTFIWFAEWLCSLYETYYLGKDDEYIHLDDIKDKLVYSEFKIFCLGKEVEEPGKLADSIKLSTLIEFVNEKFQFDSQGSKCCVILPYPEANSERQKSGNRVVFQPTKSFYLWFNDMEVNYQSYVESQTNEEGKRIIQSNKEIQEILYKQKKKEKIIYDDLEGV
jgi:hypothetical protein